jgi:uncharacterized membrane protein YhaH (DUF805 family)
MVSGLGESLRRLLLPRRHTALLAAIVIAFAVRPLIGDTAAATFVFSLALLVVMLIALYTVAADERQETTSRARQRRIGAMGWGLAAFALVDRIAIMAAPSGMHVLVGTIGWLIFVAFVAWMELRSVLNQNEVTGETISMAISVYLLLGLTWGLLYAIIFQLQPGSFHLGDAASVVSADHGANLFPIFVYFSLTTLSTIGFGDITPLSLQARYAAVIEGITGQLYLAILIARIVGMHMNHRLATPEPQQKDRPPRGEGSGAGG